MGWQPSVGHHEDPELGEKVQRQLVVGVPQNRLLDQNHVGAGLLNVLGQPEQVLALLLQDAVHGGVVAHHHAVVHVGFGGRQAVLQQRDLGVLDLGGSARPGLGHPLGQHQSLHQLGVVHRPPDLLHDANVPQIHVVHLLFGRVDLTGRAGEQGEDGIDRNRRQQVGVLRHHLAREAGGDGRQQRVSILQRHRPADGGEEVAARHVGRVQKAGRNNGRVQGLFEQSRRRLQQRARQHDHRGGPVSGIHVLGLAQFHQHLGGGMQDLHFAQQRGAVVADEGLAVLELDHLVHPPGPEGRPNGVGHRLHINFIQKKHNQRSDDAERGQSKHEAECRSGIGRPTQAPTIFRQHNVRSLPRLTLAAMMFDVRTSFPLDLSWKVSPLLIVLSFGPARQQLVGGSAQSLAARR
jgi:hypothetical protein